MFGGGKLSRDKRALVAQFCAITSTSCVSEQSDLWASVCRSVFLSGCVSVSPLGVRVRVGVPRGVEDGQHSLQACMLCVSVCLSVCLSAFLPVRLSVQLAAILPANGCALAGHSVGTWR